MSALGEYVHLKYENYKKHGVSRDGEDKLAIGKYKEAMGKRINKVAPNIDLQTLQTFAEQLKKNSLTVIQEDVKKMDQQLLKKLDILYNFLISRLKPDKNKREFKDQPISNFLQQHIKDSGRLSELQKLRKQSQDYLNDIEKTISEIKKNNYNTDQSILKHLMDTYNNYAKLAYLPKLSQFDNTNTESVVKTIDKAMENALFDNAQTAITGAFGELTIALCGKTAEEIAAETVNDFFSKRVKGGERSQIRLSKDLIVDSFVPKWMQKSKDGNAYIITMPTQNKIDVAITIGENEIGASAKATTLEKHVHYWTNQHSQLIIKDPYIRHLQEVNLFYTLAFLNSADGFENIGNHWLNMHTAIEERNKDTDAIDSIIQTEVAIQALSTGNPLKQADPANVFVYINLATGKISIISIKDILNTAKFRGGFTDKDLTKNDFKNGILEKKGQIIQDPNIFTIKIDNKSIDNKTGLEAAIKERIDNILNVLHQQKIRVSYQIPLS